jgi:oligoribonuclease NrnB/cAMP/cGMP phosphodiesterase (DHH superfamily)
MDGFSAAWCFWRKYGDEVEYMAGRFYAPPPDVTGREVYLVDFCYPRDEVAAMLQTAASVTLIDHHKTALEAVAGLAGLHEFTDLERSGATLAWDYLYPGQPRPRLLEHVEDRDLYRFKLPGTREILALMFSYEYSFELWDRLMFVDQQQIKKMVEEGAAIERKQRKDMAVLLRISKRRMVIGGYAVPVANMPSMMASDAGHEMAQGALFSACYWDTAHGRKFELRSVAGEAGGLDVSVIAKQYGGGGHEHAAGFTVPRTHVLAMG